MSPYVQILQAAIQKPGLFPPLETLKMLFEEEPKILSTLWDVDIKKFENKEPLEEVKKLYEMDEASRKLFLSGMVNLTFHDFNRLAEAKNDASKFAQILKGITKTEGNFPWDKKETKCFRDYPLSTLN